MKTIRVILLSLALMGSAMTFASCKTELIEKPPPERKTLRIHKWVGKDLTALSSTSYVNDTAKSSAQVVLTSSDR